MDKVFGQLIIGQSKIIEFTQRKTAVIDENAYEDKKATSPQ